MPSSSGVSGMDTESRKYEKVPRFSVNLSEPPRRRWARVIAAYKEILPKLIRGMWRSLDMGPREVAAVTAEMVGPASSILRKLGRGDVLEEIQSIAEGVGVPFAEMLALSLSYETKSGCTAVVATQADGTRCLARTLDWEFPQLRKATIEVEFSRDGKVPLFVATTWAGYVGVLTALHIPMRASVAVNFREPPEGVNGSPLAVGEGAWPVGILLRHCLETEVSESHLLQALIGRPLMAPTYFIFASDQRGLIITRDTRSECTRLNDVEGATPATDAKKGQKRDKRGKRSKQCGAVAALHATGILVQANVDHWETDRTCDIQESFVRLDKVLSLSRDSQLTMETQSTLKQAGDAKDQLQSDPQCPTAATHGESKRLAVTPSELWRWMSAFPVWEKGYSIYATLMVPRDASIETRVYEDQQRPKKARRAATSQGGRYARKRRRKRTKTRRKR